MPSRSVSRTQTLSHLSTPAAVALLLLLALVAVPAAADPGNGGREPELTGDCEKLQVDAGHHVVFHVYAAGVQIYRWNGQSWSFAGPEAVLFADDAGQAVVGIHYATSNGPAWESTSGSKVIGAVVARCTPDPDAIDWLKLGAVTSGGPGVFNGVTFIQRVNTVGGKAPAAPGSFVGEEARVPYTTEYYFYRQP